MPFQHMGGDIFWNTTPIDDAMVYDLIGIFSDEARAALHAKDIGTQTRAQDSLVELMDAYVERSQWRQASQAIPRL